MATDAKSSSKKVTVKKTTTKAASTTTKAAATTKVTATKKVASKPVQIQDVPTEYIFFCQDGKTMKNLNELASSFRDMSDETFYYHVNDERNDFSNWVKDIIGDTTLSSQLAKVSSKIEAAKEVEARLSRTKTS
ncbi:MAG: DUF5752 family protein [Chloroflexota bacterium]|nr:DUF5752 family protein [Chloroflexota bacterium]